MKKELIDYMAKTCHYAQDNLIGNDWAIGNDWTPRTPEVLNAYFEPVSYIISCFLAQNTKNGHQGVESDIVIDELKELPSPLAKSEKEIKRWTKIIKGYVKNFS